MYSATNTSPILYRDKTFQDNSKRKYKVKSVPPSESLLLPKPIVIRNFHQIFSFQQRITFPRDITFFL